MRTLTRLLLVAMIALAAPATAFLSPATAQDNTAVAVNKKDGKSVFKLAFSVKKVTGDVDATNTAVAYSSCTDCRTVAAAIQVVLVSGEATSASPENVAIAINYQCSECETMAAAYQFVFGDGQELTFTKEGKQRLHDLKKQFYDLKQRDDLTLEQLAAEIAVIAAQVAVVVDTEVELKKVADDPVPSTSSTSSVSTTTSTVPDSSSTTTGGPTTTGPPPSESTTTTPPTEPANTSTSIVDDSTTTTVA